MKTEHAGNLPGELSEFRAAREAGIVGDIVGRRSEPPPLMKMDRSLL